MIRGHLSSKIALELGWFIFKKRRFQGDLKAAFQYIRGTYKKAGKELYQSVAIGKNVLALNENRVDLD